MARRRRNGENHGEEGLPSLVTALIFFFSSYCCFLVCLQPSLHRTHLLCSALRGGEHDVHRPREYSGSGCPLDQAHSRLQMAERVMWYAAIRSAMTHHVQWAFGRGGYPCRRRVRFSLVIIAPG